MTRTTKKTPPRLLQSHHPVLYEINTRVLLGELSRQYGKKITLGSIPQSLIDEWAELGFDAIWLMGVWRTGETGTRIAREHPGLRSEFARVLPDYVPGDVVSSPYAVTAYSVADSLGGKAGLLSLRKRLEQKGIGIILDFVCNHTAHDHKLLYDHPDYYVNGQPGDEQSRPDMFFRVNTRKGERIIAFGKDPHYPGWTDTAQLNYRSQGARASMIRQLQKIATLCDGVRCDMAMLVLESVFQQTWGWLIQPERRDRATGEFWKAAIDTIRAEYKNFLFIAEAYWDMEWELQQLGFDYTYDKRLYDRLLREGAGSVYDHLKAEMSFQRHLVRFIENHDEPRAAQVLSSEAWHCAAAVIMSTVPGMVLLHEGQLEGRRFKLPVQLIRRPDEPVSTYIQSFYKRLLTVINHDVFKQGSWRLMKARPAWHDNSSWSNYLAFWWHRSPDQARLVVVNYAPMNGQAYVAVPLEQLDGATIQFRDMMSSALYVRDRQAILSKGLYFDLEPYGFHIFDVTPQPRP